MVRASTTCRFDGDTAGYWAPTLLDKDGNPVPVKSVTIYYGDEPTYGKIRAFPPDFRMIAGAPHAFSSKPGSFWGWSCENSDPLSPTLVGIDCSGYTGGARYLAARVFFPVCWDGTRLDSADHRSHVVYPVKDGKEVSSRVGTCPSTHPVKLPRVRVIVNYDVSKCVGCRLSSDMLRHVARRVRAAHREIEAARQRLEDAWLGEGGSGGVTPPFR